MDFIKTLRSKIGAGQQFDGVGPCPKLEGGESDLDPSGMPRGSLPIPPGKPGDDRTVSVVNPPEGPFPGRVR